MLDAMVAFLWPDAGADRILLGDGIDHRPPIGGAGRLLRFADGWATTMTLTDSEFEGLCRAFGVHELASDPRFATVAERIRHRDELRAAIDRTVGPVAARMTLDEAESVPFGRVNRVEDLGGDPQVAARDLFHERDHPVAGPLREVRPAPRFGSTPARPGAPAPKLGEHTREILEEIGLGAEVDGWLERGIVAEP